MGIRTISKCSASESVTPKAPNPDPRNYQVDWIRHFKNGMCIVQVRYHGCTTYEGKKILVYLTNFDFAFWNGKGELDPHFCDKHPGPVARFKPTAEGVRMAEFLCENWHKGETQRESA